ncbi:hypothetical protein RUA4292_01319 [Ruegeria atlantica]|uniref:Uncharacterized protein n=1 Tax=Ruegeria atlantica TaxID=81569 RepID=A0A0P1ED08_9RHOB|nr:hypothetical protein RUA4292_01319 [Ruegeria atlantica]
MKFERGKLNCILTFGRCYTVRSYRVLMWKNIIERNANILRFTYCL